MVRNEVAFISDLLKPLILYALLRNLREASARLFQVMWKSKNMIILLIIYYLLFGWVAYRMYAGTSQGNSIFPTREVATWNMMTVFAGANFITKILPSYANNRLTGVLFVCFNILGVLFFLNVTVAILYNQYLAQVRDGITNFKTTIYVLLSEVFEKHSDDSKFLTYSQAYKAIEEVIETNTRGQYSNLKVDTIIKIMDK